MYVFETLLIRFMITSWIEPLAKTGFYTSFISYLVFWSMDILIPGFVSRFFSVHLFLLMSILCVSIWGATIETYYPSRFGLSLGALSIGVLLCTVSFVVLDRSLFSLFLSVMAFFIPFIVLRLIGDHQL